MGDYGDEGIMVGRGAAWFGLAGSGSARSGGARHGKVRAHHKHYIPHVSAGPDLFEPPAQGIDTSIEAARRVTGHTARIREGIYLWLQRQGARGATAGEIELALSLSGSTVRPRLRELQGDAPWAKGKLAQRIERTVERRAGMRVYISL